MLELTQFFAVLSCTLFAGAAIYINVAEHPARMGCETKIAVAVWAPSYKRATLFQGGLAVLSFVSGVATWLLGASMAWLIAAILIGLVVPFTFIVIMPINHQLLAPGRDLDSAETRALLVQWGNLHAVRSVLSFVASVLYVCLLLVQPQNV